VVVGQEAVGATKQEMIVAGEGGVLQSCQWLALRKKQIENLLQPAEREERRGVAQAQIEASTIALPWRQALHVTLRRLECSHRLLVGVERVVVPRDARQVVERRRGVVRLRVMVGQSLQGVGDAVRVHGLQRAAGGQMQGLPLRRGERGVGYFLRQRVLERVDWLCALALLEEELHRDQILEVAFQRVVGAHPQRAQQRQRRFATEERRRLQSLLGAVGKPVDAREEAIV